MFFLVSLIFVYAQVTVVNEWESVYAYEVDGNDWPMDMVVDEIGNSYVFARSFGSHDDYLVIKYDNQGNELWVSRYEGLYNFSEERGKDIELDSENNVYVTGESGKTKGDMDFATVKYDGITGEEIWVARFNTSTPYSNELGKHLEIDEYDNIYVDGYTIADKFEDNMDIVLVKYDKNGNELWRRIFDSSYDDTGRGFDIDYEGNSYIAGMVVEDYQSSEGFEDVLLIKYDSNGNLEWNRTYDTGYNKTEKIHSVSTNGDEVVVVGGGIVDNKEAILVLKYDCDDGTLAWSNFYSDDFGFGEAKHVKINEEGEVFVAGIIKEEYEGKNRLGNGMNRVMQAKKPGVPHTKSMVFIKYGADGVEKWLTTYGWSEGDSSVQHLELDKNGVYIVGLQEKTDLISFITAKYNGFNGNLIWDIRRDCFSSGLEDVGVISLDLDNQSNVYVTGWDVFDEYKEIVTLKYGVYDFPDVEMGFVSS